MMEEDNHYKNDQFNMGNTEGTKYTPVAPTTVVFSQSITNDETPDAGRDSRNIQHSNRYRDSEEESDIIAAP